MLYVNFLTALLLCLCSSPLHSAVVFSESVNGPLSSSGNTPTILSLPWLQQPDLLLWR